MEKAIMTKCAASKFRTKQGMNKKRAQKQANKILKYGVTHKEATGELHGFMTYLYFRCGSNNTRLYGDTAYLFDGKVIISQYRIPDRLVPLVKQMNKEKRERLDGKPQQKKTDGRSASIVIVDEVCSIGMTPLPWER